MGYTAPVMTDSMHEEPLDAAVVDSPSAEARQPLPYSGGWREALDNPWLVLGMLFFVTAALGLPLLWLSRGFSNLSKIALTFAVLAWTALLLWLFWLIMLWCYARIADALA